MEIRKYIAVFQRSLWLILLAVVLAGGAAYLLSINSPKVYRASARLLIDQAPGSGGGNEYTQILVEQRLATTYVELIKLSPVLEETVDRLNLPFGAGTLASKLTVSAPPETQLIVIGVEDTDPERAALIANTVGLVFIDQNEERQSARFVDSIASWQERLVELRDEIEQMETQINDYGEPASAEAEAELSRMQTSLREAEIRYTEAFNNLEELRVEEAKGSNNVIMVEPARVPGSPIRPRPMLNTIFAAVAGGIAATVLVFAVDHLDDTVKAPSQLEEETGLSTIGAIAIIKGGDQEHRLVTQHLPRDPVSEAYRVLRTNLSFAAIDEGLRSILITSASPSEGKSTTVANLAVVLAQAGKRVIVIDSDLRRPTQHKLFGVPNHEGLTTALISGETALSQYVQETPVANLRILTSGPVPPNPAELLSSQRMSQIIGQLQDLADTIIFDTPPTLTVADASILAPQMTGCVLVAEAGRTRLPALQQAVETLHKANAHVFGVVLNQVVVSRSGYYYYRYYDYEAAHRDSRRGFLRLPNWLNGLSKR